MHWTKSKKILAGAALALALGGTAIGLPVQAAELRMAWSQDATGLDPHKQTAFSSIRLLELIYEPLVQLNADLEVVPAVASSWSFSDDGLTLTFNSDYGGFLLALLPPGAFIGLGLLIAGKNIIDARIAARARLAPKASTAEPA